MYITHSKTQDVSLSVTSSQSHLAYHLTRIVQHVVIVGSLFLVLQHLQYIHPNKTTAVSALFNAVFTAYSYIGCCNYISRHKENCLKKCHLQNSSTCMAYIVGVSDFKELLLSVRTLWKQLGVNSNGYSNRSYMAQQLALFLSG